MSQKGSNPPPTEARPPAPPNPPEINSCPVHPVKKGESASSSSPESLLIEQLSSLTEAMQSQNQLLSQLLDQNTAMLDILINSATEEEDRPARFLGTLDG